jgi:hypothetical protein
MEKRQQQSSGGSKRKSGDSVLDEILGPISVSGKSGMDSENGENWKREGMNGNGIKFFKKFSPFFQPPKSTTKFVPAANAPPLTTKAGVGHARAGQKEQQKQQQVSLI